MAAINAPVRSIAGTLEPTSLSGVECAENIAESRFLVNFVRTVNALLDLDSVCCTAVHCLAKFKIPTLLVIQPVPNDSNSKPKVFSVFSKNRSEEISRLLKLPLTSFSWHEVKNSECETDLFGFESVFIMRAELALPGKYGSLHIYAADDTGTGEFWHEVTQCLAPALKNAIEYSTVKDLSMRDALTGLFNRRVLEEMLLIESERRKPIPVAMVMIDLDDFKLVNDMYGHHSGDIVLAKFAEFLRVNCRGADLLSRYGGEEFSVMLTGDSALNVAGFAKRIINSLAGTEFVVQGNVVRLTMSIGVAYSAGSSRINLHELLRRADTAMYTAKNNGKNQACIADNSADIPANNKRKPYNIQRRNSFVIAA